MTIFYQRISCKDETPEKEGTYITNFDRITYQTVFGKQCWWDGETELPVEWWLKPLPSISRDKLIEVIAESLKRSIHSHLCEEASAEIIYTEISPILTSGIITNTVEMSLPNETDDDKICPNCEEWDFSTCEHPEDINFCPFCGSKIKWL